MLDADKLALAVEYILRDVDGQGREDNELWALSLVAGHGMAAEQLPIPEMMHRAPASRVFDLLIRSTALSVAAGRRVPCRDGYVFVQQCGSVSGPVAEKVPGMVPMIVGVAATPQGVLVAGARQLDSPQVSWMPVASPDPDGPTAGLGMYMQALRVLHTDPSRAMDMCSEGDREVLMKLLEADG